MANNNTNALNVYGSAPQGLSAQSVTAAMATTRQAQEVQAAMIVAKNFPRDQRQSLDRILSECTRPTLAEGATYEFSRGGSAIRGPSIRMAECIAQNWGNMDFGFTELERKDRESTVMAFAWDLETNTRQSRIFSVRHQRDTGKGSKALTEERDIYEMIANQAARRVRNCILSLIPGDVVDAALKQCDLTLKNQMQGVSLDSIRADMVAKFEEFSITPEMLAAFCQKQSVDYLDEADIKKLRRVYTSFKDGLVGVDYFTSRMQTLAEQNAAAKAAAKPAPEAPAAPAEDPEPAPDDDLPFTMGGLDDI